MSHTSLRRAVPRNSQRLTSQQTRLSMTRVVWAWGFGAAAFGIVGGPVFIALARAVGADDRVLGLLGAALPAMSFLQVVAARVLERTGQPRRQMLIAGIVGRSLWIVAALVPLLSPWLVPPRLVLPLFVGAILLSGVFQAFTGPAFFSWMTALVPSRVRPTFLARRMQIGTMSSLLVLLLSGYLADHFADVRIYALILVAGGFAGVLDIACFFGVKEPPTVSRKSESKPLIASLLQPLQDLAVRRFLMFVSVLGMGYGTMGAFVVAHCNDFLRISKTQTTLITVAGPMLGIILTSRLSGEIVRRFGNRPVMRFSSLCLVFMPVGWLLILPAWWPLLSLVTLVSGALFVSIEITNQNLISTLSPQIPRGTLTALVSIFGGGGFAFGSIASGLLANALKSHSYHLWYWTFDNYHAVFLFSLLVRSLNAFWIAPRLHEPAAFSTRATMRGVMQDMMPSMARNIAHNVKNPPLVSRSSRRQARRKRKLRVMRRGNQ